MSWYLKYRPKNITELGLESVKQILLKTLSSPNLPHAFLLTGPRGLGKTSTARIIARYINCLNPTSPGVPCGQCTNCTLFDNNQAVDVIEMDAASNRRIDDIRQLRSGIGLSPSQLKYKVYIIDEVHMLTTEAFNALLKTLEEPPKHVIFILATTELHKVPETIKSRCQIIHYPLATQQEIINTLQKVAQAENLKIKPADLKIIAHKARGSFRDAIKLLEQLTHNGQIQKDLLANLYQYDELTSQLFDHLITQNFNQAINTINQLNSIQFSGDDLIYDLQQKLINHLHTNWDRIQARLPFYQHLSAGLLDLTRNTKAHVSTLLSLHHLIIQLKTKYQPSSNSTSLSPAPSQPETTLHPAAPKTQPQPPQSKKPTPSKKNPSSPPLTPNLNLNIDQIKNLWPQLIAASVDINHGLQAILKTSQIHKVKNNKITLHVAYKLHKTLLEKPKIRHFIEAFLTQKLKNPTPIGLIIEVNPKLKSKIKTTSQPKPPNQDERLKLLLED